MNAAQCQQVMEGVGSSVGASLRGVDCAATAMAQAAFGRLFGGGGDGGGVLVPVLTILLTLYVAFFALSLLTGRSRIGVSALTPRMITLGLVLTFATSWMAYQSVVWNLAVGAPDQLAGLLTGAQGSATQNFADKIDVVFEALIEAAGAQAEGVASAFSPPGLLWIGGTLLLLGTVGLLATCKIALAVVLAVGPVFVVMALFGGTRGLFTGWLKALVMLAVTPLFAVLAGSLMLELAVPVLRELTMSPGRIEPRAAMAFFMIGAVHAALMSMVLKVTGTMVAGWSVFGLAGSAADGESRPVAAGSRSVAPSAAAPAPQAARAASPAPSRQIRTMPPLAVPPAANDAAPARSTHRETKVFATAPADTAQPTAPVSRARGIGSRFRSAPAQARAQAQTQRSRGGSSSLPVRSPEMLP